MNKTITFSIVAIIIILLIFFFINSNKTEAPIQTDENSEQMSSDEEVISSIPDGTYTIDTSKSEIVWTGKKTIIKDWVDSGTINIQSGSITLENNSVVSNELVIDMNSIKASSTGRGEGESQLEGHLKSADFFDVENHPTSTFKATGVTVLSSGEVQITGDLTIKGITNQIQFPAKVTEVDGKYRVTGSVNFDRTKWDIKFGSNSFFDNLGDNVIDDMINIQFDILTNE